MISTTGNGSGLLARIRRKHGHGHLLHAANCISRRRCRSSGAHRWHGILYDARRWRTPQILSADVLWYVFTRVTFSRPNARSHTSHSHDHSHNANMAAICNTRIPHLCPPRTSVHSHNCIRGLRQSRPHALLLHLSPASLCISTEHALPYKQTHMSSVLTTLYSLCPSPR